MFTWWHSLCVSVVVRGIRTSPYKGENAAQQNEKSKKECHSSLRNKFSLQRIFTRLPVHTGCYAWVGGCHRIDWNLTQFFPAQPQSWTLATWMKLKSAFSIGHFASSNEPRNGTSNPHHWPLSPVKIGLQQSRVPRTEEDTTLDSRNQNSNLGLDNNDSFCFIRPCSIDHSVSPSKQDGCNYCKSWGMVLGKINNIPKVIWLAAIQRLNTRPLLSLQQRVSCDHLMSEPLGRHQQMSTSWLLQRSLELVTCT